MSRWPIHRWPSAQEESLVENMLVQVSREELVEIVETAVERKLLELFADVDAITLKPEVKERLLRQEKMVAARERGHDLADIIEQLDLG
jgi:hypothetical protein